MLVIQVSVGIVDKGFQKHGTQKQEIGIVGHQQLKFPHRLETWPLKKKPPFVSNETTHFLEFERSPAMSNLFFKYTSKTVFSRLFYIFGWIKNPFDTLFPKNGDKFASFQTIGKLTELASLQYCVRLSAMFTNRLKLSNHERIWNNGFFGFRRDGGGYDSRRKQGG